MLQRLTLAFCIVLAATGECDLSGEGTCKESQDETAKGSAGLALLARKTKISKALLQDVEIDPLQALISSENEAAAQEYYAIMTMPDGAEATPDVDERERTLGLISSYVQDHSNLTAPANREWSQSFKAGYADAKGKFIGGSEIVHLTSYEGKLYAASGYWMDDREGKSAGQVLRLDSPTDMWQQDLDTMTEAQLYNAPGAHFSYCLRVTALKELHVVTDSAGKKVDKKILLAACSAYLDMSSNTGVSIFVKTSSSGAWKNSYAIVSKTTSRKTPRAAELYVDRVTGIQRVFLLVGDFGILSGAYDSAVDDFVWDPQPETSTHGAFPVRALGIAESKNGLFFSVGKELWRRNDGTSPSWRKAKEVPEPETVNTEVGGIRGLSPEDEGKGMIFIWTPDGSSEGKIFNVSESMATQSETSLRKLYEGYAPAGGGSAAYSLGGYNNFFPVTDPKTGQTCLIFGFQQVVKGADPKLLWHGFFAGAPYGVRKGPGDYYVSEVGGPYEPGKPPLVGARTFAVSPFAGEEGVVYAGGFDANFKSSTNTAWIFKAGLNTVLGNTVSPIAPTSTAAPASNCGVCTGTSGILDPNRIAGTAHGFQYKCKDAENFVKRNAATSGCTIPDPTWPTKCCHGCNLCQGADNHLTPSAVAGMNAGKPFTCEELWRYMQSPSPAFTCAVAQASYGPKCCTKR
mmetsp:Transcript_116846/g.363802  ORF Transcript_116846/g.363802 Transcript_116846/m.363802 type:complete len:686 (-) Transcript_116846:64-2121(-)